MLDLLEKEYLIYDKYGKGIKPDPVFFKLFWKKKMVLFH